MATLFDLFANGLVLPFTEQPSSVGASQSLALPHGFLLIDDGSIPATAVIQSVTWYLSQGSYTPGVIPVGVQPYLLDGATPWSGPIYTPPPLFGQILGVNDQVLQALTAAILLNPVTNLPWTRADLFADSFGWYNIWNNTATATAQSAQESLVDQFFARIAYSLPTEPAPLIGDLALSNLTKVPETWTFAIDGQAFQPNPIVFLTLPSGAIVTFQDATIISEQPEEIRFIANRAQMPFAGTYTLTVRNEDGQTSNVFTFQMLGPGVIVEAPVGFIHRYGYAFIRPLTPNLTHDPLRLAPGASIDVFNSETTVRADLFDDALGTNPLPNPLTADDDAFYSYYVTPAPVDEQFSGGGILTPYTIGDAIPLDPRVLALETAVTLLTAEVNAGLGDIADLVAAIQAVPLPWPLGGSLTQGVKDASRVDVLDAVTISLNAALLVGYTVTVFVTLRTDDAGTSVKAFFRDVTNNVDRGSSAVVVATVDTVLSFTATLSAGTNNYRLQLQPGNGNAFIYGIGYVALTKP